MGKRGNGAPRAKGKLEVCGATAPGSRGPPLTGANNDSGREGRRSDKDDGDP
jgi:hypothetical protein